MPTRILVAEDFEPYRVFVTSLLNQHLNFQVICEVGDGLQAVDKALDITPDLVLLDIGLPCLSGIEAARRILDSVPTSKVVFLTQETSAEVIQLALSVGAYGYVFKARAGSDLVPAIEATLQGRRFVSGEPDGNGSEDPRRFSRRR